MNGTIVKAGAMTLVAFARFFPVKSRKKTLENEFRLELKSGQMDGSDDDYPFSKKR